jgi:hypothetical protein
MLVRAQSFRPKVPIIDEIIPSSIVVAGDSCDGIAATFKITPDEFYAMVRKKTCYKRNALP